MAGAPRQTPARHARAASAAGERPHVLVVDDDTRLLQLLGKYLRDNGYYVTTAENAKDGRAKMAAFAFDLLVLDVMMPDEDGIELATTLRRDSDVPILMLTARGEPEDRILGFEAGADDYLAKPFEPRELLLRIGSILRRAAPHAEPLVSIDLGECTFDIERGVLRRGEQPVRLTSAEAALLGILARNAGTTFSRLELCRRAGGASERSIDVQVARLRRKVEPDPKAPRYLQTVWGAGYVLVPDAANPA
jgi:two-component system phosphate regulon response regulator OmpR